MPVQSEIDAQARLVRSSASGVVTFAEVRDHQESLLTRPDFDPNFDQLYDATEVSSIEVTGAQVQSIAMKQVFSNTSRRAYIATAPSVYGMLRIYETYLDSPATLRVFRDRSSALQWLGRES